MIQLFLLNLVLAVTFMALTGGSRVADFLIGFLLGYVVLALYGRSANQPGYGAKLLSLVRFGGYFLWILIKANWQIAVEVITPGMHQRPRIIRYPVGHLNTVQVTTLANAITLTPGTLVVDISEDGRWLYIHCMYAADRDRAVADLDELADRLQRRVFNP